MSDLSGQCEDDLCLRDSNSMSIRVFPCLYHCKKMLCIKHLSEHDKYIEKQIQYQKQLEHLWTNYSLLFNEEKVKEEFQKLKIKLENYYQLNREVKNLLMSNHFHNSTDNHQILQNAIETIQKEIEQENQSKSIQNIMDPKIELVSNDTVEQQSAMDHGSLSSSINSNDGSEAIDSPVSMFHTNGSLPPSKQQNEYVRQNNESNYEAAMESDNDDDTVGDNSLRDENIVTPNRSLTASRIRGHCPLTHDGAFGISCLSHGIRLCPRKASENQRTYRLHEHFRRVHHLTPMASLTIARAIGSGLDPMTTVLFNSQHIILNIDELRTVICPISKPFKHYPLLHIDNFPCDTIKQVRHLKDHLRRAHRLTIKAANVIVKAVKADVSIDMIEFPEWIDIIEDD